MAGAAFATGCFRNPEMRFRAGVADGRADRRMRGPVDRDAFAGEAGQVEVVRIEFDPARTRRAGPRGVSGPHTCRPPVIAGKRTSTRAIVRQCSPARSSSPGPGASTARPFGSSCRCRSAPGTSRARSAIELRVTVKAIQRASAASAAHAVLRRVPGMTDNRARSDARRIALAGASSRPRGVTLSATARRLDPPGPHADAAAQQTSWAGIGGVSERAGKALLRPHRTT